MGLLLSKQTILVVVALYALNQLRLYLKRRGQKQPPMVSSYAPLGFDLLYQRLLVFDHPFELMEKWRLQYAKEGIYGSEMIGRRAYFLFHPEAIKHVLSINWTNYSKGDRFQKAFYPLLGDGIFNTNGDEWQNHRTMARPHFAKMELGSMIATFHRHLTQMSARLDEQLPAAVDVQKLFFEFTLASVGDVLMGTDVTKAAQNFGSVFDLVQIKTAMRSFSYPYSELVKDTQFFDGVAYLDEFCDGIVQQAESDPDLERRTDMLAEYIKDTAKAERGSAQHRVYLRNMLKNMLIAGRDTTACLLTWTFYELSQHPQVLAKVVAEIQSVFGDASESVPTIDQLAELKYTKHVLYEVLRLHPSVPINVRFAVADDIEPHTGITIEAGCPVIYSAYITGRAAEYWGEDAHAFDPDRFEPPRIKAVNSFAFVPFHAGPRICLGQNMAVTEAKTALAYLLPKYAFALNRECVVDYKSMIILQARNGMVMDLRKRV